MSVESRQTNTWTELGPLSMRLLETLFVHTWLELMGKWKKVCPWVQPEWIVSNGGINFNAHVASIFCIFPDKVTFERGETKIRHGCSLSNFKYVGLPLRAEKSMPLRTGSYFCLSFSFLLCLEINTLPTLSLMRQSYRMVELSKYIYVYKWYIL